MARLSSCTGLSNVHTLIAVQKDGLTVGFRLTSGSNLIGPKSQAATEFLARKLAMESAKNTVVSTMTNTIAQNLGQKTMENMGRELIKESGGMCLRSGACQTFTEHLLRVGGTTGANELAADIGKEALKETVKTGLSETAKSCHRRSSFRSCDSS